MIEHSGSSSKLHSPHAYCKTTSPTVVQSLVQTEPVWLVEARIACRGLFYELSVGVGLDDGYFQDRNCWALSLADSDAVSTVAY